jgi:hypothetical protein
MKTCTLFYVHVTVLSSYLQEWNVKKKVAGLMVLEILAMKKSKVRHIFRNLKEC